MDVDAVADARQRLLQSLIRSGDGIVSNAVTGTVSGDTGSEVVPFADDADDLNASAAEEDDSVQPLVVLIHLPFDDDDVAFNAAAAINVGRRSTN